MASWLVTFDYRIVVSVDADDNETALDAAMKELDKLEIKGPATIDTAYAGLNHMINLDNRQEIEY